MLPDQELRRQVNNVEARSQCTYRCVVLPDARFIATAGGGALVSMHLQVRGAP